MASAAAVGFSSSLSLEAGPPPMTLKPAGAPPLKSSTVQPVPAVLFSALPTARFSKSLMLISFIVFTLSLAPVEPVTIKSITAAIVNNSALLIVTPAFS